ncbi:MAG: anaerobic ribonucleoside-triphosphate reductase activating protein, partial [Clostridiales bacterium]|nr:anaerobic ribonucleoside-triphosphate reductase activating protein [Clostridiales bacterium]
MKIFGIQKLSLLDYPGKVACTLFTGGCNLRCPFCHNASLVVSPDASDAMEDSEVLAFLKKREGVLDGVCISGGEPLMQRDIADFIRSVRALGYSVKLDTNGCFPDALEALISEGLLDYIAMDIKNSPRRYPQT